MVRARLARGRLVPIHPINGNLPPGEAPAVPTVWNGEGARLAPVQPINGDPLLGVAPAVPTDVVRWGCGARAYAPLTSAQHDEGDRRVELKGRELGG